MRKPILKSAVLGVSLLGLLSPKQIYAVQESDMKTGETKVLDDDDFVEPVYLDDLEGSTDHEAARTDAPIIIDRSASLDPIGPSAQVQQSAPGRKRWRAYGSLGVSTVSFAARAAVRLPVSPYFSVDPSLSYWSRRDGEYAGNGFGPEVAFFGRVHNPTMFTPYAGAGVGYEKWQQTIGEEQIDDDDTGTGFYFFGLNIMMTDHFGIDVARRIKKYVDEAPLDRDSREPGDNPQVSTEISFQAVF